MCHAPLQVSKAVAAHESVSEQLSDTERALTERSEQLTNATATLEAREADLSKLSQQHQALILQHERTEGELSDLTNVLKTKQKDNMALQQGCASVCCSLHLKCAYANEDQVLIQVCTFCAVAAVQNCNAFVGQPYIYTWFFAD